MQIVVIDSNVFISGIMLENDPAELVLDYVEKFIDNYSFPICNQIKIEVERNLSKNAKERFNYLLTLGAVELNNSEIPNSLVEKYKKLGLKKGDIHIAAFSDFINADYLISQNRHFIRELKQASFKVLTAEEFLKQLPTF